MKQSPQGEGAEPNASAAPSQSGQGAVVLVVEDEPRVRGVTVARLASRGYRVVEASRQAELAHIFREALQHPLPRAGSSRANEPA